MAITNRTLFRLQYLQFTRVQVKSRNYGDVIGIIYIWIISIIAFVLLKKDDVEIPTFAYTIVALSCLIPDFVMKLIMIEDNTVMDAFLKTRPVSQSKWERYLVVSQFWTPSNMVMPLCMLLPCFLFLPFFRAFSLLLLLYLASVFGGFLVMLFKHRGRYQPEAFVKARKRRAVSSSKGGHISGLQIRSFLRSKRLKTLFIYLGALFYIQCIGKQGESAMTWYFMTVFLMSGSFVQYGFSVEANFFGGLWTRPVPLERLLADKYRLGILMAAFGTLLCVPLCIWKKESLVTLSAVFIFNGFFANLLMLVDPFNCVPFDLFGKAFYNNQGRNNNFKVSAFISILAVFGFGYLSISVLDGWKTPALLFAFGLIGFIGSKPYLKWVAGRFDKKKYKYLAKYYTK